LNNFHGGKVHYIGVGRMIKGGCTPGIQKKLLNDRASILNAFDEKKIEEKKCLIKNCYLTELQY
jgi:hypothetical protein